MRNDPFIPECTIIGGLAMYPAECESAVVKLKPEDFTDTRTRELFELFQAEYRNSGKYDFAIIAAKIKKPELSRLMRECFSTFTTTACFDQYISDVSKNGRNHRLITQIARMQFEPPDDVGAELQAIVDGEQVMPAGRRIDKAAERVKKNLRDTKKADRLFTGFNTYDDATGGLFKKMVSLIAAFPSTGKTTLILNICKYQYQHNHTSAIFSLEMPEEQLLERIASDLTGTVYKKIRDKNLSEAELEAIDRLLDVVVSTKQFEIYDDIYTIEGILEKIAEIKPELAIIDYFQVIRVASKQDNPVQYIMQEAKRAAKKYNCHIMFTSQFVRTDRSTGAGGKTKVREPTMFDLYGGATIEQGADIIGILSRPYVTDPTADPSTTSIVIAKNKLGKIGKFDLHFDGDKQRFTEPNYRH